MNVVNCTYGEMGAQDSKLRLVQYTGVQVVNGYPVNSAKAISVTFYWMTGQVLPQEHFFRRATRLGQVLYG